MERLDDRGIQPEKTADIWQRYNWFPREMTPEKRAQKFHTDDTSQPRSEAGSNEPCFFALLQFAACLKGVRVGLNKPYFPVNIKNLVTFSAAELSSNL